MTRAALAFDRLVVFLVGVVLTAGGAAAVLWSQGQLRGGRSLQAAGPLAGVDAAWWPWACGFVGVVLVVTGLWWLSTHRRTPGLRDVRLADDEPDDGALRADAGSVASAAADALGAHPAVLKAGARSSIERGVPTITLSVTISARRSLTPAVAAADATAATVTSMLGDTVAVRTRVHVRGRDRRVPVA